MDTKYLRRVAIYVSSAILALALIFYLVYHLFNGFSTDIRTVSAAFSSVDSVISGKAYIFRDEFLLNSSGSGSANYLASDGEKVSINQAVADVFSDSSGYNIRTRVANIDNQLKLLDKSSIGVNADRTDTSSVDAQIYSSYTEVIDRASNGEFLYALKSSSDLLIGLNKRQLITGEARGFDARIEALRADRQALVAQLSGKQETILTNKSGYFYTETDGFEEIFTVEALDALTFDVFDKLVASLNDKNAEGQQATNKIGKIVSSYSWYVAIKLEKQRAAHLVVGNSYDVEFPYNYDMKISMKLEKVVTEPGNKEAILVLSSGKMPKDFNYMRNQEAKIITDSFEGLRVPSSSVRVVEGVKGVYTLYGSKVVFKKIDIIYEGDGYYLVSNGSPIKDEVIIGEATDKAEETEMVTQPQDTDNGEKQEEKDKVEYGYLALHDQIIVSGKGLSHGMVFY